jgi:hypothetical protein
VGSIVFLCGFSLIGRAEEDAVSYDERQTLDGEDADLKSGPVFSGDVRVRGREVLPEGSTYQAAPPELQHNVYFYQRTRMALGPVGRGGSCQTGQRGARSIA